MWIKAKDKKGIKRRIWIPDIQDNAKEIIRKSQEAAKNYKKRKKANKKAKQNSSKPVTDKEMAKIEEYEKKFLEAGRKYAKSDKPKEWAIACLYGFLIHYVKDLKKEAKQNQKDNAEILKKRKKAESDKKKAKEKNKKIALWNKKHPKNKKKKIKLGQYKAPNFKSRRKLRELTDNINLILKAIKKVKDEINFQPMTKEIFTKCFMGNYFAKRDDSEGRAVVLSLIKKRPEYLNPIFAERVTQLKEDTQTAIKRYLKEKRDNGDTVAWDYLFYRLQPKAKDETDSILKEKLIYTVSAKYGYTQPDEYEKQMKERIENEIKANAKNKKGRK